VIVAVPCLLNVTAVFSVDYFLKYLFLQVSFITVILLNQMKAKDKNSDLELEVRLEAIEVKAEMQKKIAEKVLQEIAIKKLKK